MREVFTTEHLIFRDDGLKEGKWYEKGAEDPWVKELAEKLGKNYDDAFEVLLTRKEWNDIQNKMKALMRTAK